MGAFISSHRSKTMIKQAPTNAGYQKLTMDNWWFNMISPAMFPQIWGLEPHGRVIRPGFIWFQDDDMGRFSLCAAAYFDAPTAFTAILARFFCNGLLVNVPFGFMWIFEYLYITILACWSVKQMVSNGFRCSALKLLFDLVPPINTQTGGFWNIGLASPYRYWSMPQSSEGISSPESMGALILALPICPKNSQNWLEGKTGRTFYIWE